MIQSWCLHLQQSLW